MGLPSARAFDLAQRLHSGDPSAVDEIRAALEQEGSMTWAAIALGVSPRCLQRWRRKYPRIWRGITLQGPGWPKGLKRKR